LYSVSRGTKLKRVDTEKGLCRGARNLLPGHDPENEEVYVRLFVKAFHSPWHC